jgi:predicted adenylyl cyclase CyaB
MPDPQQPRLPIDAEPAGERLLVELKARCPDLDAVRARLAGRARLERTLCQVDTYFAVPRGRLKLRETPGRLAALIFYERPDVAGIKASDVRLAPVASPDTLRPLLAAALGIRAVVTKTREIWRLDGVQVHLDTVEGLGTFLELETLVAAPAGRLAAEARLRDLLGTLGIDPDRLEARSYGDLLTDAPAPDP